MSIHLKTRRRSAGDITLLLSTLNNPEALRAVIELTAHELHAMAKGKIRREPPGCTLRPTELLNETCLQLLYSPTSFQNRRHFFGAASQAMRRVLVDRARRRRTLKRGGCQRVDLTLAEHIGFQQPDDLLNFEAALQKLEVEKPKWSTVVELHVFGGLSLVSIARSLGLSECTVRRYWSEAKKWLRRALAMG